MKKLSKKQRQNQQTSAVSLITLADKASPVAEQYRTIRTNIQFASANRKMQTIGVTSAGAGEGKSTTTANLAIVLADAGQRVLLVDADMRKATVHKSVADSVERPVETHEVNYDSVLSMLELTRKTQKQLKRFVFASSAAVYGDNPELPKKETSPIKPMTQYAVDKFAAERTTLNFYSLYNVPTSAVRFFNVYGPNQNPESPYSGVISILIDRYQKKLNGESSSFTLFGDGNQLRDFIYIDDVVKALLIVAESQLSLGNVYNIGTENEKNLNDVINELNEIYSIKLTILHEPERKGDIRRSVADISKLKLLGFESDYTIYEGLSRLVSFMRR